MAHATAARRAESPQLQRILLATDFSSASQSAVPFARIIAERFGATVFVTHVIPAPGSTAGPPEDTYAYLHRAREFADQRLREFVTANHLRGISHRLVVARGSVCRALNDVVQEQHVGLIVLGTRARSWIGKLIRGSMAEKIFRAAPCPVLAVGPEVQKAGITKHTVSRILCACDFSYGSLQALAYATKLAERNDAEVILLHIAEAAAPQEALRALLPAEARECPKLDILVRPGEPAENILKIAAQRRAELIVMGARRGRQSLTACHLPWTTAYRVVAHARCPVLLVQG